VKSDDKEHEDLLILNLQKEGYISGIFSGIQDFFQAIFVSFLFFYDPNL